MTISVPVSSSSGLGGCLFHSAPASTPATVAAEPAIVKAVSAFVALSKFVIANDKTAEVKAAFRQRRAALS